MTQVVNIPLCNPNLAACTVATNPIFYDQSLPAPTDIPEGMQPVPVPTAYIETIRFSAYSDQNYYYENRIYRARSMEGAQAPAATGGYYIAGLDKSSEDLAMEAAGFFEAQAAEEEKYLRDNFTAGGDYYLNDYYDSFPAGLRPPEKYRGWYFSVQMVGEADDSGNPVETPVMLLSRTPRNIDPSAPLKPLNNGQYLYAPAADGGLENAYIVEGATSFYGTASPGLSPSFGDDHFYAEPVASTGLIPIFAAVDPLDMYPPDRAAMPYDPFTNDYGTGNGVSVVAVDDFRADSDRISFGWDSSDRLLVAGGFLTTSARNPVMAVGPYARNAVTTVGPAVGLFYLADAEAQGFEILLDNQFGIPRDATQALRPYTVPAFAVADLWAISESSVWLHNSGLVQSGTTWLHTNVSSRIPVFNSPAIRPDWVKFRKVGGGMMVMGTVTGRGLDLVGNLPHMDWLKRGKPANTVASIGVPALAYRYGPRILAKFPLLARAVRWAPVRVISYAAVPLALADIFDAGLGAGERLRRYMPWYDAGNKLDDVLFNTAHEGDCSNAMFPSICWKYLQAKTWWNTDEEAWEVFNQMTESVNFAFPRQMRDSALPILALNHLVADEGNPGRLVLDWESYRDGLKSLRESDGVQSVFSTLKLMEDAKNTYGSDYGTDSAQYELLDISTSSALAMQDVLNENIVREDMRDYVRDLLDRNDLHAVLEEAVSVQYRKLAQLNVESGLAMGIELSQTTVYGKPGINVQMHFAQEGTDAKLQNSDTFTTLKGYESRTVQNDGLFKGQQFELKTQDGVVFARTTTPDGMIITDMTAAWDESKGKFMITTQTTTKSGRVINPTQVTYSNYAMLPLPIPNVMEETERELSELEAEVAAHGSGDKEGLKWKKGRIEVLKMRKALLMGGQAALKEKMDFLEAIAKALDPSNPDADKNRQAFIDSIDFDATLYGDDPATLLAASAL